MEKPNTDQVVLFMDQQQQNIKTQPLESQHNTARATRTLRRRVSFTKSKARNVELNFPPAYVTTTIPESDELEPIKPNYSTTDDDDDDSDNDDEELEGGTEEGKDRKRRRKRKIRWRTVVEWVIFITILVGLISSLTIESLKKSFNWGLELWKWCLMVMVVFSGRLVSGWLMVLVVFLMERNFMLRERVLYFVYGLRKSFQNCVWLALVLLAWTFMINAKVHKKNKLFKKVVDYF